VAGGKPVKADKDTEVPKRARGRPPKETELVSQYPSLTVKIPPTVKFQLNATATIVNRPVWRIVTDALELYFRSLPESDQKLLKTLADRLADTDRL
jgi:hypothetical protein